MSNKKRRYGQEFIKESVDYALASPSVKSAAENLGVPEATRHGWVTTAKQSGEAVHIEKMLSDLRKQITRLEQAKAILKKRQPTSRGSSGEVWLYQRASSVTLCFSNVPTTCSE